MTNGQPSLQLSCTHHTAQLLFGETLSACQKQESALLDSMGVSLKAAAAACSQHMSTNAQSHEALCVHTTLT
jgi:hypothetical protein